MGLDITVHTKVEPVGGPPLDGKGEIDWDEAYEGGFTRVYVIAESIAASYAGLPGEPTDTDTWVRSTGESWHFHAGSYSGYNLWREALAQAAHGVSAEVLWSDRSYADKPFYLLINFADNEGAIGSEAAARLAREFEQERDRVLPQLAGIDEYNGSRYDTWARAFAAAADGGMVEFG